MTSKVNLPRGDIKLGDVMINDVAYPVKIDLEWMRALAALVDRTGGVIAPTTTEIVNRISTQSVFPLMAGEDGADGFGFPGPQGIQGAPGLTFRGQDGEDGNDGFGFPGAKGDRGLQGLDFRGSDGEDGQDATGLIQWPIDTRTMTAGIVGTTTNNNAITGTVGEYIDSAFSSTAITTATYTDVGTVTLTAGDWDLEAILYYSGAAGTNQTSAILFIGEVSGNNSTGLVIGTNFIGDNGLSLTNAAKTIVLPRLRKQPTASTTYYLKAYTAFTVSTMAVSGILTARRVR